MDSCNNNLTKSTTSVKPLFKEAGSSNENEMNPDMFLKSKVVMSTKKNIAGKHFMSPTISAANKKKILTERNETSDAVEQNSVEWSSSFGSKAVKFTVGDSDGEAGLKPYDPVKNYLSPRPKFLRYNPNRRRRILNENDEGSVRNSTNSSINGGCGLELGVGSLGTTDSSSQKESVERVENVIDKEDESEDDEEEVVEDEEDRSWSLNGFFMGFLKWFIVVVALVLMTQGICSVNSPTGSDTLETLGDFSDWSFVNRAAGLNFSEAEESINIVMGFKDRAYVYGAASVEYSRIGTGPVRDADLEARRFEKVAVNHDCEKLNMVQTVKEFVEGENGIIDDVLVEVENGVIDDVVDHHIVRDEADFPEVAESEVLEINDEVVNEIAETEVMESYDEEVKQEVTVLTGLIVVLLISVGTIYCSKTKKSTPDVTTPVEIEKEDIKETEPSTNPSSLIQQKEEQTLVTTSLVEPEEDVSKEISHINTPSVELLGEFVFGEVTSSVRSYMSPEANASNSSIQTSSLSFSQTTSNIEMSTGDSRTARKPRRKTAESSSLVTPSSVRRSSRIQSRSVMSP